MAVSSSQKPAEEGPAAKLRAQLQQLNDVRQRMKAILDEVPAQKEKANGLRARMERIRVRVGETEMERALKKYASEGPGTSTTLRAEGITPWEERARDLDRQIAALPQPPPTLATDGPEISRLKTELQQQIHALGALQAATQLAFRALSAIDGLERSVAALEAEFPTP